MIGKPRQPERRNAVDAVLTDALDADGASWALSDVLLRTLIDGEDAREGALDFTEKRTPAWHGR